MPIVKHSNEQQRAGAREPGDYLWEVFDYEFKLSAKKGTEYVELKCREEKSGCQMREKLFFTENAAWRINDFCRAIGKPIPPDQELDFNEDFAKTVVMGSRFWASVIKVEDEKRKGRFYNETVSYLTNKPIPPKPAAAKAPLTF